MSSEATAATAAPEPATPGKKPMSNLAQRLLFGTLGAVLLLGCVWYGAWTFAGLFAVIQAIMLREFYRMMRVGGNRPAGAMGIVVSVLLFAGAYFMFSKENSYLDQTSVLLGPSLIELLLPVLWFLVLALITLSFLLREMVVWPNNGQPFANLGSALAGLLYVSLPMSLLCEVAFVHGVYDYRRVVALFFLVWTSDTGAYAAGKLFGRHKLAPSISPGKTWEGAVGGFLLTLGMGWALGMLLPDLSLTYRLVAAAVVAVFGPLGDLAESMLKRSVGIKDSGRIMPGHGGLLDRFDAFLFILPVLALLQLLVG
ncbi:MAG: phosphatidate cytidylyltransferase [Hymenobacter sp.]|nr:phosphatidate cytidylyltransferase [Hymenobacter sp.]